MINFEREPLTRNYAHCSGCGRWLIVQDNGRCLSCLTGINALTVSHVAAALDFKPVTEAPPSFDDTVRALFSACEGCGEPARYYHEDLDSLLCASCVARRYDREVEADHERRTQP